jgi:hypothetical protein
MADILFMNDRRVFVKVSLPRPAFEALVERFGGNRAHALREVRLRWEGVLSSLHAGVRGPDGASGPSRLDAYARASRGE